MPSRKAFLRKEKVFVPEGEIGTLPLYSALLPAGFPSPAEAYVQEPLDLGKLLIPHPSSTYLVRAGGDSMIGAGIHPGDILVVDRSISPRSGQVVIAVRDGELTVKRLLLKENEIVLLSENPAYPPISIPREEGVEIWGVVTFVIHPL